MTVKQYGKLNEKAIVLGQALEHIEVAGSNLREGMDISNNDFYFIAMWGDINSLENKVRDVYLEVLMKLSEHKLENCSDYVAPERQSYADNYVEEMQEDIIKENKRKRL